MLLVARTQLLLVLFCSGGAIGWRPSLPRHGKRTKTNHPRDEGARFYRSMDDSYDVPRQTYLQLLRERRRLSKQQRRPDTTVRTPQQLRSMILDQGYSLHQINVDLQERPRANSILDHETVKVLTERYRTGSKPGQRDDDHIVALSLEGGGMRGAVSAGMASAIVTLGLTDGFDRVYGSSAGSVIGAYLVSRQMCMDVYVDILPAAKTTFVCLVRLFKSLAVTASNWFFSNVGFPPLVVDPGMNISFVLDGIMDQEHGIRPIDMDRLKQNDEFQQLRVASSYVKDGKLSTRCFGGTQFFDQTLSTDQGRHGIFACLEASMAVPGATGPPVQITEHNETCKYFDAFCVEPLPFRSAVKEGASHVLMLCSRPEGFAPKTAPGVYETAVAPLYFNSHGEPEVARFFKQGGQQYIYAEDLLTLEEGKHAGPEGILVPPTDLLYGVEKDSQNQRLASNRHLWNRAHILPVKVPLGTPELPTLEQERDEVGNAVRSGFAAAYDLLAPVVNVTSPLSGSQVADLLFPRDSSSCEEAVLQTQLRVLGDTIQIARRKRKRDSILKFVGLNGTHPDESDRLGDFPGLANGKMAHLAMNLQSPL